jgi:hypothetical protein
MASAGERTFFVEGYVPNLDGTTAASLSSRLRRAILELEQEGLSVRWLESFALIEEETYVWMLVASDVNHVALVNERAGTGFDHVVEMIVVESARGEPGMRG